MCVICLFCLGGLDKVRHEDHFSDTHADGRIELEVVRFPQRTRHVEIVHIERAG